VKKFRIIGLGEVLWDVFEDGKALGGAPCNFAYHVNGLGHEGLVFSRVGRDALGDEILAHLGRLGMSTDYLQRDPIHPTGTVNVRLDERGNPGFTIVEGVAYDFMEPEASWLEAARTSDALCFGTLAQRNDRSRKTIQHILEAAADAVVIYDVNLRQHFYSARIIRESLARADVLKLNEQEVLDMRGILAAEGAPDAFLRGLMRQYDIRLVCVTRGAGGCTLYGAEGTISRPVPPTEVVDTVGSGDAFTAGLAIKFLEKRPLNAIAEAANLLGAYVAGCRGATPALPQELVDRFNRL